MQVLIWMKSLPLVKIQNGAFQEIRAANQWHASYIWTWASLGTLHNICKIAFAKNGEKSDSFFKAIQNKCEDEVFQPSPKTFHPL